jgi:hypothetical protein
LLSAARHTFEVISEKNHVYHEYTEIHGKHTKGLKNFLVDLISALSIRQRTGREFSPPALTVQRPAIYRGNVLVSFRHGFPSVLREFFSGRNGRQSFVKVAPTERDSPHFARKG